MKSFHAIAAALLLGCLSADVRANNNLFLPGDAYFPTLLTQETLEELEKTPANERVFEYSALGGYEMAFCGYSGYAKARFERLDDALLAKVAAVYRQIRESTPRLLIERKEKDKVTLNEMNGVSVLFYPASTKSAVLGLRYNENWREEAMSFGHRRVRLCCLVPEASAIEISWRDAKQIDPLPAQLPQPEPKPVLRQETPVLVGGPLRIIVTPYSPHEMYEITDDDFRYQFTLTDDGIDESRWTYGEFMKRPWRFENGKWLPPESSAWDNDIEDLF